jgi:hypothetical protein
MAMRPPSQIHAEATDELELSDNCAFDCCSEASDDSSQDSPLCPWSDCGDEVLEREFEREIEGQWQQQQQQQQQQQGALPVNVEHVLLPVPQRPTMLRPESASSCPRMAFHRARKAKKVFSKPAPPLELLSLAGSAGAALRSLRHT